MESVSGQQCADAAGRGRGPVRCILDGRRWANANRGLKGGDLVFVETAGGRAINLHAGAMVVNGAIVALEPQLGPCPGDGRRLFLLPSPASTGRPRPTASRARPTSSFVYACSSGEGDFNLTLALFLDCTDQLPGRAPTACRWTPENYSLSATMDPCILRRGLELSLNVMTVRLAQAVGMRNIVDLSKKMGVVDDMSPNLAMSLGAGRRRSYRITAAYAAFGQRGAQD